MNKEFENHINVNNMPVVTAGSAASGSTSGGGGTSNTNIK